VGRKGEGGGGGGKKVYGMVQRRLHRYGGFATDVLVLEGLPPLEVCLLAELEKGPLLAECERVLYCKKGGVLQRSAQGVR